MSKFIDSIKIALTGKKYRVPPKITVKYEPIDDFITFDDMNGYRAFVLWEMFFRCRPQEVEILLDNFTRELKELIYGDLRHQLRRLEVAVIEEKREEALSALRDINREIY